MLRIRIFRILLPLAFVAVLIGLVYTVDWKPAANRTLPPEGDIQNKADEVRVKIFGDDGELSKTLDAVAGSFNDCGENCMEAQDIRSFEIARRGAESLVVVQAASSRVIGPEGDRDMDFEGPVRLYDPDLEIEIEMPALGVDEAPGLAISKGSVHIEHDDRITIAERLQYGLNGQPTQLDRLEMRDQEDGQLSARRALLHDGVDDIEFQLGMRFKRREDERFSAESARVLRESGITRELRASGHVSAMQRLADGGILEIGGDALDVDWDASGRISTVDMRGNALVEHRQQRLASDRWRMERQAGGWAMQADGSVQVAMPTPPDGKTGQMSGEQMTARLSDGFELLHAEIAGTVEFVGDGMRAEAGRATIGSGGASGEDRSVQLWSDAGRRARFAQGPTRVAADEIATDTQGNHLDASGRVEATLLETRDGATDGLFRTDQAIHFISQRLQGHEGGQKLRFTGDVRGWQGDQNLAAKEVTLDQPAGRIEALGEVSTRLPRERGGATARIDDFIQVTSERLLYLQQERTATFEEAVRTVLAEGWIESGTLIVHQAESGSDEELQRLEAAGDVKLEFIDGETRSTGRADRLVYIPAEQTIWLYGDDRPAEVRREGDSNGTSRGRVLRYRLDDGSLQVESGTIIAAPKKDPGQGEDP